MELFRRSTFPFRAYTFKISRCAPQNRIVSSTLLTYGGENIWSERNLKSRIGMKTLILRLTFAGTWYPDKTTSSSKNLVLAVILGVSLERKTVIFRVKVSCTRQTINWVMLRSPKLHRVIYLSSWKILIIVVMCRVSFIVCLTSVTLILIATFRPHTAGLHRAKASIHWVELFVPPWLLVIGVSQTVSDWCITNLAHGWWGHCC